MAREITQQQRAEAMLRTIGCYPWPYRVELLLEYAITARQEALREAAERLGVGDSNGLLAAPCLWCGYNGEGYYQAGTHGQSCPWNTIGGCDERLDRLAREGRE